MSFKYIFAIVAVIPLVCAYGANSNGYGSNSNGYGSNSYNLPSSSYGLDELTNAATGSQQGAASITGNAEIQPTQAESERLGNVQNQIQFLNNNQQYQNLQNSEAIAESLAESNLASNIRQGNINVVSPNVVDQGVFRSLFVPTGRNNHQVIATQPLPPIVVTQPGAPPAQVSSGPAAVVKAAPVIYKIKPSVIYQQEVINKVPTPLSLNPVYVKVYKPGKKIDAPVAPVVQPVYNQASYQAPSYAPQYGLNVNAASDSYSNAGNSYANQQSYGASPAYAQSNYGPSGYAPAGYASAAY